MTSFELIDARPSSAETLTRQNLSAFAGAGFQLRRLLRLRRYFYLSELDQAFVVWGAIALIIFSMAQFSSILWTTQAVIDAALTGVGIASTSGLTWRIACEARLRWVVCLWAVLMMVGMVVTAGGIFGGVGLILANLCLLWLGICAAGYGVMAVGMRSRCFSAATLVHGLAIAGLSLQPGWQFFTSGLIMGATLFFFSVVPWDMRAVEAEG